MTHFFLSSRLNHPRGFLLFAFAHFPYPSEVFDVSSRPSFLGRNFTLWGFPMSKSLSMYCFYLVDFQDLSTETLYNEVGASHWILWTLYYGRGHFPRHLQFPTNCQSHWRSENRPGVWEVPGRFWELASAHGVGREVWLLDVTSLRASMTQRHGNLWVLQAR